MKPKVKPRTYRSPLREESALRTRRVILEAAGHLLVQGGYGALTMQGVAAAAGVALDTVYAAVGRKPVLVRLMIETAISGTEEVTPAPERQYVRDIRAASTAREKLALYATAISLIHQRLAPIVRALRDAAAQDAELAKLWKEVAQRRARNMRMFAKDLIATGEVRADLTAERTSDVLWSMNAPEFYTLLVDERGWTPEDFAAWLADAWARLLLAA
jgi:AcrR family transcriptional regulator